MSVHERLGLVALTGVARPQQRQRGQRQQRRRARAARAAQRAAPPLPRAAARLPRARERGAAHHLWNYILVIISVVNWDR